MPVPLLEIAAGSLACALAAQEGGADRVELCGCLAEGGITPSPGVLAVARERLRMPVHVLIRPRPGDFLYTDEEVEVMYRDIEACVRLGFEGVVIGALNVDGGIDPRCRDLKGAAGALSVTFHRAFDASADLGRSLEAVIALGCERVLTSGGRSNALAGSAVIADLVRQAAGRIRILAGAGIRAASIAEVARRSHADELHGSARTLMQSGMRQRNPALLDLSPDHARCDVDEVRAMKAALTATARQQV
jgi:copper homeostasis protein